MAKRSQARAEATRRRVNALLSLAALLAVILSVVLVSAIYFSNIRTGGGAAASGSAGIAVHINVQGFTTAALTVGVYGSGANASVPLREIGKCVAQLPLSVNITPMPGYSAANRTLILPCSSSSTVVFTGLRPFSNYLVYVNGSSGTYCVPGVACPLFILYVHNNESVETLGANSLVNVTFSV
ncbi:MAG: hypothetical protein QXT43_00285 [Candidatus Micrarchaeaceae archaeon]